MKVASESKTYRTPTFSESGSPLRKISTRLAAKNMPDATRKPGAGQRERE